MRRANFMYIFYGLILLFLDFRIGSFDILPDALGYVLIAVGLSKLVPFEASFGRAQIFAMLLAGLALLDFVQPTQMTAAQVGGAVPAPDGLFLITMLVRVVFDLVMIWDLCQGIIELADRAGNQALVRLAASRRNLYIALTFLFLLLAMLGQTAIGDPLFVIFMIFTVIVMVLFTDMVRQAANELVVSPPKTA